MAKIARVLVPTDFSIDSLRTVLDYLEKNADQQVEFVLACGYDLGDSITGLLGFTKEDHLERLENEDFIKGCEMIKSRFKSTVVELYADLIISKNVRYLRNYVKGNAITHIALPASFAFTASERSVFNIATVFKDNIDTIQATPVRLEVKIGDEEGIDRMDRMFFRNDWRVSYE